MGGGQSADYLTRVRVLDADINPDLLALSCADSCVRAGHDQIDATSGLDETKGVGRERVSFNEMKVAFQARHFLR
jgi:hypothetical protein